MAATFFTESLLPAIVTNMVHAWDIAVNLVSDHLEEITSIPKFEQVVILGNFFLIILIIHAILLQLFSNFSDWS